MKVFSPVPSGVTPPLRPLIWLSLLLCLCIALAATPALAQTPPPARQDPVAVLESASKDMEKIRAIRIDKLDDAGTENLRELALSAQSRTEEAIAAFEPELADVQARLKELGTPADGVKESGDVAAQRAQLTRTVATLDSQIKLARLWKKEAEQALSSASQSRRTQLGARLGERAPSVLGGRFWRALGTDVERDLGRLDGFIDELRGRVISVSAQAWVTLAVAIAALLAVSAALRRGLAHLSATRVPAGRLRRSLYAFGVLLTRLLTPGLMAHAVVQVLTAGPAPSEQTAQWLDMVESIVWFGGVVAGLAAALLMPRKPTWRLPPIPDDVALRLQWFPRAFAITVVLGWVAVRSSVQLEASASVGWAISAATTLMFSAVLGLALWQIGRHTPPDDGSSPNAGPDAASKPVDADSKAGDPPPSAPTLPLWMASVRTGAWLLLAVALVSLLLGFVTFSVFLVTQAIWGLMVASAAYLLAVLVDDLFMSLVAARPDPASATESAKDGAGPEAPQPRTREQTAVLLSGVCRVIVGFLALVLLLAPYGEGPIDLFLRADRLQQGLSIGAVSIQPDQIFKGILVLLGGLFAVRLLKQWLAKHYMPTTRMDAGMRMSVTTLFGYVGGVAVVALALASMDVGLERVAWVASALSVGIGFGLQAVVQNFVSGLILLAERPVKVGDWVSLSGVEGDIRRINVRATEIQMGDRSTVIVPNSEFITKIVRNVTYAESLGMVQFKLPMPLATDTERARAVLLAAFRNHPGVLDTPPPNVQLDGIDGTNFILNATGFVSSPRSAYSIKSDLLFEALGQLRAEGLLPKPADPA